MKQEHLEIARVLYKPTPQVEELVLKLCDLFDTPLANGVTVDSLSFNKGALRLCGFSVKKIVRGGQHCGIEIHWYPNFGISSNKDPFCSAFVLRYNSLSKLYREVDKALSVMGER
jgi:hypothetical protein